VRSAGTDTLSHSSSVAGNATRARILLIGGLAIPLRMDGFLHAMNQESQSSAKIAFW